MSTINLPIIIATRQSRLALWQAEYVKSKLEAIGHRVQILSMSTQGDEVLDKTLAKIGGKGLFVKELETALLDGRADIAVHSLKDVPMDLPPGFCLAAVLEREDPHDAWVSNDYACVADVPYAAVVGTSSLRRAMLLQNLRSDLQIEPLRGNLDTRLRKLDAGDYTGIVLALAGLKRLGLDMRVRDIFSSDVMPPSAGQGALAIECLQERADLRAFLPALGHVPTHWACAAERAVSRAMGGSCSVPLAAHAVWHEKNLFLRAHWGQVDETTVRIEKIMNAQESATVNSEEEAKQLGQRVAADLLAQGAK